MGNLGEWTSRGYLPHYEDSWSIQSITFRLADSLPLKISAKLKSLADNDDRRIAAEQYLDSGYGGCILKDANNAAVVVSALQFFHEKRYFLHGWVVMPNHVHVLVEPVGIYLIREIVHSWKSFTSRRIKSHCHVEGFDRKSIWQPDYFDRFIREENHYNAVLNYIHQNPVKAGLVASENKWPWSSASVLNQYGPMARK